MNKIDQTIPDFKLELSRELLLLQRHKFRRPKYMNIPRSLAEDPRWIKLSPEAAKALITILLIAGDNLENRLPALPLLHLRLRAIGQCFQTRKFLALIRELNQHGFLLKTTPELQSYRATEIEKKEGDKLIEDQGSLRSPNQTTKEAWRESGDELKRLKNGFDLLSQRLRLNDLAARLQAARPIFVPRDLGTEVG